MLVRLAGRFEIGAALPLAAAVLVYAASFNVSSYCEWRYDSFTRDTVRRIRERHAAAPRSRWLSAPVGSWSRRSISIAPRGA